MIKEYEFKNRDEWLEIRHKYIGGSDAGAVVGMNPYKSAYSLWAEKTDKIAPFEGNITTKVGAFLEELVAQMFCEETGKKVRKKNRTMVNDDYPFACANVDRLVVGEKALLEIKTTNSIPLMRKLKDSGEFPRAYYCQCVHYMAVTGLEKAYLAVLINCRELKIYELERDEAEIKALMEAEREFWSYVTSNTAPSPDGLQSTSETISEMYPESSDNEVSLFAYETELAQIASLNGQIKDLKKIKDEMENRVKVFMGEAGSGYSSRYKVTWRASSRVSFDSKAFAKDHPNINLAPYQNTTSSRTFRLTERRD